MDPLLWLAVGFAAGLITKWILPREDGDSWAIDVLCGIIGAMLGGYMVQTFALYHTVPAYPLFATLGALLGAGAIIVAVGSMTTQPVDQHVDQ